MNILFISPNSPRESIGGVERYITNLIDYCNTQSQFQAYIILPTSDKSYFEKNGNVVIYHDNSLSIPKYTIGVKEKIAQKARLFSVLVEKIITENNIDIICGENFHLGLPPAYSLLLNMIAGLHKIPLVLRLHSFAITDLQIELVNQLMWNQISCVSKSVAGDCFHKGADINCLSTDYLGVNTKEFNKDATFSNVLKEQLHLSSETKIILTATRIILGRKNILQEKGVINLIQAFSKLSPRYPNLHLLIAIGKPPISLKNEFDLAYEMLLGYIKLHNIEEKTIVKSFKLNEMVAVYRGSDLFVLPSQNETFGQVFIEAMSCGLPVIGTKVGGIPEIISDSYNGYLVSTDDSSLLAQKMEKLINDNSTRERFVRAGIRTVNETFTSDKQFASFIKLLEQTISSSKA